MTRESKWNAAFGSLSVGADDGRAVVAQAGSNSGSKSGLWPVVNLA
jgi:hypothetical protein